MSDLSRELTERMLKELSNDNLSEMILASAELLKKLKEEAIRRGIWDELKRKKV